MNYKELLKQKLNAQAALVKVAIDASRAMTPEEQTQFDALETEIKNLEKTIEMQDKVAARQLDAKTPGQEPIYAVPASNKPVWKTLGDFLNAVRLAADPRGSVDPRLLLKNAPSGASEGVPSDGGYALC